MNIIGMGPLEVLVILLLAFILLGPQKMVDGARLLGRAYREVRRMSAELPAMVIEDEPSRTERRPSEEAPRGAGGDPSADAGGEESRGEDAAVEGPVAFQPGRTSRRGDESEQAESQAS